MRQVQEQLLQINNNCSTCGYLIRWQGQSPLGLVPGQFKSGHEEKTETGRRKMPERTWGSLPGDHQTQKALPLWSVRAVQWARRRAVEQYARAPI